MSRPCWSGAEGAFDHVLRAKSRLCKVQVPSLIHSLIAHLRSARSTLGAVVANYRVNKTNKIPALRKLPVSWGLRKQKINKQMDKRALGSDKCYEENKTRSCYRQWWLVRKGCYCR